MVKIKKKYIFILLFGLTVFLMLAAVGIASADEEETITPEETLLSLINEARRHPLETAAAIGMDPDRILADLPEMENILKDGLPPLTLNENLSEAAFAHTWDMFARGYYSKVSPDGKDAAERIAAAGYPAVLSGESLGMILFANFINPEEAARLIFEYMFQDELDPSRTEKRNILDPCLREAGISIQTGTLALGNGRWNVYLATCDFGSLMSCPEGELFNLINQARTAPLETAESLGMDPEELLTEYPQWADLLTEGLPPLAFNLNLAETARAHAADMLENGYYSCESPDGQTIADRIAQTGYAEQDFTADELLWRACLGKDDGLLNELAESNYDQIRELMRQVFRSMFSCALKVTDKDDTNPLFSDSLREFGIGLAAGVSSDFESICGDRILLMTLDFGDRPEIDAADASGMADDSVSVP
jgi:uncharacterized protein YkwD